MHKINPSNSLLKQKITKEIILHIVLLLTNEITDLIP